MNMLDRLELWKQQGAISPEQQAHFAGLVRDEPFSLALELNILLYTGILAFVAGLGWTVSTWSEQLGDVVVLFVLSAILAVFFWYCFSRAPGGALKETAAPKAVFDYARSWGCLFLCVELTYLEARLHLLSGTWD